MPPNSSAPTYRHGEPCWADVQTCDVAAAKDFYGAVFGWRFEDLPTPDGRSYAKAFLGQDLVATIAPQNPHQESLGTEAQWNIYLAADDAKAIAEEATHLGGAVQFGPEQVADTGVMVFIGPPGGGTTGVWQPGTHIGAGRYNEPGALSWAELLTPEPQSAVGFFQQLFGHEVTEYPQDDGGTYTTLMVSGAEVAGIAAAEEEAGWQIYFGATDVAETVRRAVAAGAEVLIEPDVSDPDAPGATATLRDPQGGVFSLLEV
ncbi:VOC family protein [Arthrobacter sp. B6]|uniref:VOC family protein n=1 Tax=Arthrobacter sp. B6 TaxID=1570137 RepID=UPI000834B7A1|nr:VOC family protein [Arthrobacter sp. B6]